MRIANRWSELEAKAQRVADLPYREAVAVLAEKTDEAAEEKTESHKPSSIFTWPEEDRRKTTTLWWDILADYTVVLDHRGWDSRRIAEFLGHDQMEIDLILFPQPPERFTNPFECGDLLKDNRAQGYLQECYRNTVRGNIAGMLTWVYRNASYVAECEGWPDSAKAMEVLEHHQSRIRDRCRNSGTTLWDIPWEARDEVIAWDCCAITDARAALGIEPPREELLFVWDEFRQLAEKQCA
jgi:hypothetical protein